MKKIIRFLIVLMPVWLIGQDLSRYYELLEKGNRDSVSQSLPDLKKKFPNSPDVLYLSGLCEIDGEKALVVFKDVINKYPQSTRADDAFLKVVEFIYTKGLYNKTVNYAKEMIVNYPNSDLIGKSAHLLLCSFNAMNQKDSVDYYTEYYTKRFPGIQVDFENYSCAPHFTITPNSQTSSSLPEASQKSVVRQVETQMAPVKSQTESVGMYALQFGAFLNENNAVALKSKLKSMGYEAYIQPLNLSGKTLLAVRIGSFRDKNEARSVGEKIKSEKQIDFFIVKK